MLGREPRLPHTTMRWLIIALMVINGIQLILLQATINATLSLDPSGTWTYLALSFVALLLSGGLLAYAFARGRRAPIKVQEPRNGSDGRVSSSRQGDDR